MSSDRTRMKMIAATAACVGGLLGAAAPAHAALTIIINNLNAAGVGFNDPTPVAPVGGNPGTTLGAQRLFAFAYAANLWGATLTSNQPVIINAQFSALTCTATTAVLGSAGATSIFRDFPNAPKAATWYSYALANKIAGAYLGTANAPQINANFNVNLGLNANCLPASTWYYGLDSNEPAGGIDFVAVLQHEMAHGLGFQTFTNGSTGAFQSAFPSIWDHYLLDSTNNVLWKDATAAQRVASAISVDKLVWSGSIVNTLAPQVLRQGLPGTAVSGPQAGVLGGTTLQAGEASFGAALTLAGVTADLMPVVSSTTAAGLTGPGCGPLTANDAKAVQGRIALIDRGVCGFAVKAKNAQNAGAIAVVIANNAAGPAPGLGGTDPTVTIPTVSASLADANLLKDALKTRSRTASGVIVRVGLFGTQLAGADTLGRVKMFAPNPFQGGSSVSHFDTTATPNQLMEPSINGNLTQSVVPPQDLTLPLFQEIGW
jgi:hypothetical protein